MNKKTVIFDLDGTHSDIDIRRDKSLKLNGKLDWDIFSAPSSILSWDKPNLPVIKINSTFPDDGFKIVIFSGRNDRGFFATKKCIHDNDVLLTSLFLIPDKFKDKSLIVLMETQ